MARMYRGEHHPTDILASVLFAALWLTATTMLVKPNKGRLRLLTSAKFLSRPVKTPVV